MNEFESVESKPAIQSLGMVANGAGIVTSAITILTALGIGVSAPQSAAIFAIGSLAANIAGLFGRKRAKQRIQGIFS